MVISTQETSLQSMMGEWSEDAYTCAFSCLQVTEDESVQDKFFCTGSYYGESVFHILMLRTDKAIDSDNAMQQIITEPTKSCVMNINYDKEAGTLTLAEQVGCFGITFDLENDLEIDKDSWRVKVQFDLTTSSAEDAQDFLNLAKEDMKALPAFFAHRIESVGDLSKNDFTINMVEIDDWDNGAGPIGMLTGAAVLLTSVMF